MEVQGKAMRGSGPLEFAQVKHGVGVQAIADHFLAVWRETKPGRAWLEKHGAAAETAATGGAAPGEKRKLEEEKDEKNGSGPEGGDAKKHKGEGQ